MAYNSSMRINDYFCLEFEETIVKISFLGIDNMELGKFQLTTQNSKKDYEFILPYEVPYDISQLPTTTFTSIKQYHSRKQIKIKIEAPSRIKISKNKLEAKV